KSAQHASVLIYNYSAASPARLRSSPTRRSSDLDEQRRADRHAGGQLVHARQGVRRAPHRHRRAEQVQRPADDGGGEQDGGDHGSDRKSTRLNSSHVSISYAVFCLKKKIRSGDNE